MASNAEPLLTVEFMHRVELIYRSMRQRTSVRTDHRVMLCLDLISLGEDCMRFLQSLTPLQQICVSEDQGKALEAIRQRSKDLALRIAGEGEYRTTGEE